MIGNVMKLNDFDGAPARIRTADLLITNQLALKFFLSLTLILLTSRLPSSCLYNPYFKTTLLQKIKLK